MAWEKYLKIVVDHTKVDADLTDFPLAIVLSASAGTGDADVTAIFDELGANKYKIKLEDASENQKYVEIETWDATAEKAVLHAKVDLSSTVDTVFRLYYDATQADNTSYVGVTGETAAQNVWDSNFAAVYHMAQDPSGGSGCIRDSTGNANDGTPIGSMASGDLVDGPVGKAIDFDGSNDYIDTGYKTDGGDCTVEAIFYRESHDTQDSICTEVNATATSYGLYINLRGSLQSMNCGRYKAVSGDMDEVEADISTGAWYSIAFVRENGVNHKLYVDGSLSDTEACTSSSTPASYTAKIGGNPDYAIDPTLRAFNGKIANIRISGTNRPGAWVKATWYALLDNLIAFSGFKVSGTVKEGASNAARTVRCYNRATGDLLGSTTSNASTGSFTIAGIPMQAEVQVVALDDAPGTEYNDLIFRVTPAEN